MANIKSAIKRMRQNEVRRLRNRAARSKVRSAVKLVTSAAEEKAPTIQAVYRDAVRTLDKAVTKGVLHRNTVSRKKSRLARLINASKSS